jgi:ketosteroid isomerase-like protein
MPNLRKAEKRYKPSTYQSFCGKIINSRLMTNKSIGLFLLITFIANSIIAQQVDLANLNDSKTKSQTTTNLYKEIAFADSCLFTAFNHCDSMTYKKYFTDDLEFYHDRGGLTVSLKSELKSFNDNCATDLHLRRELVKNTLEVEPIKDYGAIQIGSHRFYHTNKDGTEKLNGTYKFIHVWQKKNGDWKISRVISYGHD